MSDPKRLIYGGSSELEVALLRSARADVPPAASRARVIAAIGLATSAAAVTTTATTSAAAAKGASWIGGTLALKLIGASVLVGAIGLGGLAYSRVRARSAKTEGSPETAIVQRAPMVTSARPDGAPRPLSTFASASVVEPPVAPPLDPSRVAAAKASGASAIAPPRPSASSAAESPLARELLLLDTARASMEGASYASALRTLDAHDREFPSGVLTEESQLLRIDTLSRMGDRAGARARGAAFLAAHPASPHASRVHEILASLD